MNVSAALALVCIQWIGRILYRICGKWKEESIRPAWSGVGREDGWARRLRRTARILHGIVEPEATLQAHISRDEFEGLWP